MLSHKQSQSTLKLLLQSCRVRKLFVCWTEAKGGEGRRTMTNWDNRARRKKQPLSDDSMIQFTRN